MQQPDVVFQTFDLLLQPGLGTRQLGVLVFFAGDVPTQCLHLEDRGHGEDRKREDKERTERRQREREQTENKQRTDGGQRGMLVYLIWRCGKWPTGVHFLLLASGRLPFVVLRLCYGAPGKTNVEQQR